MNIGTKSVIYGIHNPIIHGALVAKAWHIVHGERPGFKELIAVVFHDVGYLGLPDMDGKAGVRHPELSERIVNKLFSDSYINSLVRHHSRSYAALDNAPLSKLALPDKYAFLLYPKWFYLFLANSTGEIEEYKAAMGMSNKTNNEWYELTRAIALKWCLKESNRNQKKRIKTHLENSGHSLSY